MRRDNAEEWDKLSVEYASWREAEFSPRSVQTLFAHRPERCLVAVDAGCGPGIHAVALANSGVGLVVAFDVALGMARLARRRARELGAANVAVAVGDAEHPPLRRGCADFAYSISALHNTDPRASLPGVAALVGPQGRLLIQMPVSRFPRLGRLFALPSMYSLGTLPRVVSRHGLARGWRVARFLFAMGLARTGRRVRPTLAALSAHVRAALPGAELRAEGPAFVTIAWSPSGDASSPQDHATGRA